MKGLLQWWERETEKPEWWITQPTMHAHTALCNSRNWFSRVFPGVWEKIELNGSNITFLSSFTPCLSSLLPQKQNSIRTSANTDYRNDKNKSGGGGWVRNNNLAKESVNYFTKAYLLPRKTVHFLYFGFVFSMRGCMPVCIWAHVCVFYF